MSGSVERLRALAEQYRKQHEKKAVSSDGLADAFVPIAAAIKELVDANVHYKDPDNRVHTLGRPRDGATS